MLLSVRKLRARGFQRYQAAVKSRNTLRQGEPKESSSIGYFMHLYLATFNLVTLVTSEITFFKSSLHSRCDVVKENALWSITLGSVSVWAVSHAFTLNNCWPTNFPYAKFFSFYRCLCRPPEIYVFTGVGVRNCCSTGPALTLQLRVLDYSEGRSSRSGAFLNEQSFHRSSRWKKFIFYVKFLFDWSLTAQLEPRAFSTGQLC